ncbi:hypothetical protein JCM30760_14510 [Thiomicrorhabdus hydrogeniphila]
MEEINDIEVLQQTIKIQSCLIEGHSIEAVFRNRADYILERSNADFCGMCIVQKDTLRLEFMIEKSNQFHQLFKRYNLQSHTIILDNYLKMHKATSFNKHIIKREKDLYQLLGESLSKNKINYFQESTDFKEYICMPLLSLEDQLIGFLFFCYFGESKSNDQELVTLRTMIETIIRPFHDVKSNTFKTKNIQILNEIPILTKKEKQTLKKLLDAKTYTQIAKEMHVSVNTVKTHVKHIYAKYEVNSKLELYNRINSGM